MKGRKKKPIEIKELQGTLRPDRVIDHMKPVAVTALVPPPAGVELDAHAKQVWMNTADLLSRHRVLTEGDLDALAVYCLATSRFWAAQKEIDALGLVMAIETKQGLIYRRNPAVDVASQQWTIISNLMSRFGLTPADRQNVPVIDNQEKEEEW